MAATGAKGSGRFWNPWRVIGWGFAAALLMAPAVAMQFTREVQWDETDFIVMGLMLGAAGLGIEFLVRKSPNVAYRLGAIVTVLGGFLTIWANLAVGMIGSEDNPYNLWFFALIVAVFVGAIAVRFRSAGMALVLAAASAAYIAVGAVGLSQDFRGGVFSIACAAPWLLGAALFWNAALSRREGA